MISRKNQKYIFDFQKRDSFKHINSDYLVMLIERELISYIYLVISFCLTAKPIRFLSESFCDNFMESLGKEFKGV